MTTKHTPGKWVACGSESNLATWVEDGTGKRVCTMRQCEDDWANAELIASAPALLAERDKLRQVNADLLAALIECADLLNAVADPGGEKGDYGFDCNDALKTARAAIARAEEE